MIDNPPYKAFAQFELGSPEAAAEYAARLGALLRAGDVICLSGSVGAGKTHIARSLIQSRLAAVGVFEDVPSPTFTLVQTYLAGSLEIWHADLYRLTHPHEVDELGLIEAFEAALCLVEWPDRIAGDIPDSALWVSLESDPNESNRRYVRLSSGQPEDWRHRLPGLVA